MSSIYKKCFSYSVPLILVLVIDQLTKKWAMNLEDFKTFGLFKFGLVYNYGFLLGWLADFPHHIKATILVTFGTIIFSSYVLLITLLPIQSNWLRIGLSILTGGILGNVTDRLTGNNIIDFISISFSSINSPYYNFADLFQWIGYVCIFVGIYKDSKHYWPTHDWRSRLVINSRLQYRCGVFLSLISFFTGLTFLFFGYCFFRETNFNEYISYYFYFGFLVLFFIGLITFILGVYISHRIAGPVYTAVKYIEKSIGGTNNSFKLRKNDEFKELEEALTKINEILNEKKSKD